MKPRMMATATLLFGAVYATQGDLSFERVYKLSEANIYDVSFTAATPTGQVDISMVLTQTVKKVYDDGSADIESQGSGMKVKFNGKEMDMTNRPQPATTIRLSKYGVPYASEGSATPAVSANFLRLAYVMPQRALKVGESYAVDYKDAKDPKATIKGTIVLESVKDRIATLVSKLEVTNDKTDAPMKLALNTQVETGSKMPIKVTGTVSNLPSQNGVQVTAIQFALERKS